jgi:Domain of unknown function (DUF222)
MTTIIERMFEEIGLTDWDPADAGFDDWVLVADADEWIPEPPSAHEPLREDWEFPLAAGEDPAIPAANDELVHEAELLPLGPSTLPLILSTPYDVLSPEAQSLALRRLTEFSAYVEALRTELTSAIAGPEPTTARERQDDYASQEIAVATRCSVDAADNRIGVARDLAHRLTATLAALHRGDISYQQAQSLSQTTHRLPVCVAREIEAKVLRFSHRQDIGLFNQALRRWTAKLDPEFSPKARDARKDCEVTHTAFADGTGQLYVRGPLELTATINLALSAVAEQTKLLLGGTAAQRKLAALRDAAEATLASPGIPRRHGRPPTINVTIDLATLLGLRDNPAEIPGLGPLPPDAARWLLADGAPMRRLVTDPLTGQLLDHGTNTYVVPPDLADYLIAQTVTSATPHSSLPADRTDMEHNVPHDRGGATDRANCTPVERRWHRAKTHGGWTYCKHPDNSITWTSPTGLTCDINSYDYELVV